MADTHGFEIVAEVVPSVLVRFLGAAWDSGVIPHSTPIAPGTSFAGYQVADGTVNLPRAGLGLTLDPAHNALALTFAGEVQVHIANPPIPSASFFDLHTTVTVKAAPGVTPAGSTSVGLLLTGLPQSAVTAQLTSGDPIGPITQTMIAEYVHARFVDGTVTTPATQNNVSFLDTHVDVVATIDEPTFLPSGANQLVLSFPVVLRASHTQGSSATVAQLPIEVTAQLVLTTALDTTQPGHLKFNLSNATIAVAGLAPAANAAGANYTIDKTYAGYQGINLDDVITAELEGRAHALAAAFGPQDIPVPTVSQIETFIAAQAHAILTAHGDVPVWTPSAPSGTGVTIDAVVPQVIDGALAIAINPGVGADASALENFVPSGSQFAIGVSADRTISLIQRAIHRPESEGGFGATFPNPPKVFPDIEGHEVKVTRMDPSLTSGAIHLDGDVTVVDAIAGSIDVDAGFTAEIGLTWVDNPDGSQSVKGVDLGHDVSLGAAAWIISLLIGFVTFGIIGGIVVLVVDAIADHIISSVGGSVITNQVTGQVESLGAWPQQLEGIGTVVTRFTNPITIDGTGLVMSG
jgi:hypothetical protein